MRLSTSTIGETLKAKLPQPHQGQIRVQQQARRINLLAAGRRWRKTTLCMAIAVQGALGGGRWFWGAPTFDQVRVGWGEAIKAVGGFAKFRSSEMTATFPGGGLIIFRSLDKPDNARGHTVDGLVIDEAGYVKPAAWYEALRPMLMDTDGLAWLIGTPEGRNWFWREHVAAPDREDTAAWQIPTVGCYIDGGRLIRQPHPLENPDVPFSEIEHLWATMPERVFRQEVLAEFIEDAGGVFRNVSTASILSEQPLVIGDKYAIGVDWAKYRDFTVLSVINLTHRQQVKVDRFNQIDYTLQMGRLVDLVSQYTYSDGVKVYPEIVAESNAMGAPLIEQLERRYGRAAVQPYTMTNASKKELIEALALSIERGDLALLADDTQKAELQAFETVRLPSGLLRYQAPEGLHDDMVIALGLAHWPIAKPKPRMQTGQVDWYAPTTNTNGRAAPARTEDEIEALLNGS